MPRKKTRTLPLLLDELSAWLDAHTDAPEKCGELLNLLWLRSRGVAASGNLFERIAIIIDMKASERGESSQTVIKRIFDTDHPQMVYTNLFQKTACGRPHGSHEPRELGKVPKHIDAPHRI